MQNQTDLVGLAEEDFKAKTILEAIEHVFDSLSLPEQDFGQPQGIGAERVQPDAITTQLRGYVKLLDPPHQTLASKCGPAAT